MASKAMRGLGVGLASLGQSLFDHNLAMMREEFMQRNRSAEAQKERDFRSDQASVEREARKGERAEDRTMRSEERAADLAQRKEELKQQQMNLDRNYRLELKNATTAAERAATERAYKDQALALEQQMKTLTVATNMIGEAGKTTAMGEKLMSPEDAENLRSKGLGLIESALGGSKEEAPQQSAPMYISKDTAPEAPPKEQRQPGTIYNTPRGPLKWTGDSWLQPQ